VLAQRADNPPDVARGEEFFGGFDEENAAVEDVRAEGEPACGEDLLDDLKAAAPGAAGDRTGRSLPAPRLGRLALAEAVQGARVAPVRPGIFRLAGVGDLERFAVRRAARSDRAWMSSTLGPGPRCTWEESP
jgi:hypothetical protein